MEYTAYLIQGWAYTGLDPFLIVSKKSILGPDMALEPVFWILLPDVGTVWRAVLCCAEMVGLYRRRNSSTAG